jgi:DNA-binding NarL/FixJ family response regulator
MLKYQYKGSEKMNKTKMIIIDDDINVIDSLKAFLEEKCYIEGFTKSKEGIKRINEVEYDILVLDYYIDELNGDNVIEEIRKFNNDLYILLLTGYSDKVPGIKSLENMQIQSYCEKSADFDNIIVSIESAIKSIEFFKNSKHSIGERIKQLRKHYSLNQEDVAKYLGVQRTAISSYESGDAIPPTITVIKLAKLFNVTTDYLLCYEFKIEKI